MPTTKRKKYLTYPQRQVMRRMIEKNDLLFRDTSILQNTNQSFLTDGRDREDVHPKTVDALLNKGFIRVDRYIYPFTYYVVTVAGRKRWQELL